MGTLISGHHECKGTSVYSCLFVESEILKLSASCFSFKCSLKDSFFLLSNIIPRCLWEEFLDAIILLLKVRIGCRILMLFKENITCLFLCLSFNKLKILSKSKLRVLTKVVYRGVIEQGVNSLEILLYGWRDVYTRAPFISYCIYFLLLSIYAIVYFHESRKITAMETPLYCFPYFGSKR